MAFENRCSIPATVGVVSPVAALFRRPACSAQNASEAGGRTFGQSPSINPSVNRSKSTCRGSELSAGRTIGSADHCNMALAGADGRVAGSAIAGRVTGSAKDGRAIAANGAFRRGAGDESPDGSRPESSGNRIFGIGMSTRLGRDAGRITTSFLIVDRSEAAAAEMGGGGAFIDGCSATGSIA